VQRLLGEARARHSTDGRLPRRRQTLLRRNPPGDGGAGARTGRGVAEALNLGEPEASATGGSHVMHDRDALASGGPPVAHAPGSRRNQENRLNEYGDGSICGFSPCNNSATSLPVPVACDKPSIPCPAAMTTFAATGAKSMTGLPSYTIGRQPHHSSWIVSPTGSRKYAAAPSRSNCNRLRFSRSS